MFELVANLAGAVAIVALMRPHFSTRRVGGLRFFKLGRLTLMFCVSRRYRPFEV